MSQMVTHSNVTCTNLFLFLFSNEMVRTKRKSARHTRKRPPLLFYVWHPDRKGSSSYMWHDSIMSMTWLIHTCGMTHSYVWHDSLMQVIDLNFKEDFFHGRNIPWLRHATWMSHVTRMNESCHTYVWIKSHVWMRHITYEWVMSQRWISHVTHMNHICDMTH